MTSYICNYLWNSLILEILCYFIVGYELYEEGSDCSSGDVPEADRINIAFNTLSECFEACKDYKLFVHGKPGSASGCLSMRCHCRCFKNTDGQCVVARSLSYDLYRIGKGKKIYSFLGSSCQFFIV